MASLSTATVGTNIWLPVGSWDASGTISKVVTVTAANITCANGVRVRIKDGLVVGSSSGWGRRHARVATDADVLDNRIACAKSRLQLIKVTPENIDAIEGLLRG